MFDFQCPECGKGQVRATVRTDYKTKVRGVPVSVPEAVVGVCQGCGAEFFDPSELRRWSALQRSLEEQQLLAHNEIAHIRSSLGMPIGEFARLLGCTRQSIYNWERADRLAPQLRTIDLLLRLIRESTRLKEVNVVGFLKQEQRVFESPQGAHQGPRTGRPVGKSARNSTRQGFHVRPREDFDQLFGVTESVRNLPLLSPLVQ